jgi:hypothetical protein
LPLPTALAYLIADDIPKAQPYHLHQQGVCVLANTAAGDPDATAPATHGKHAALLTLDAPAALPALHFEYAIVVRLLLGRQLARQLKHLSAIDMPS